MRNTIIRAVSLIGAAGAVVLAGGGIAVASANGPASVTGPEVISGAVHGKAALANNPHIPLTLTGVVPTSEPGFVLGGASGKRTHTLATKAGDLTVRATGKQHMTQTMNPKTCRFTFTARDQFTFVPGMSTGKFAGATGPGAYQVTFAAFAPRYTSGKHKGQCNTSKNAKPLTKGALASFLAAGVMTVK